MIIKHVVRVVLIMIVTVGMAVPSAFSSGSEMYRDEQFEIWIPEGWFTTEVADRGERTLVAVPDSVPHLDIAADSTIDTPAMIDISVSMVPLYMRDLPIESYAEAVAEVSRFKVEGEGYNFELLRGPHPTQLSDLPAAAVTALADDTVMESVVTVHGDYVYRLTLWYETEVREKYEPLLEPVKASFKIRDSFSKPALKSFSMNLLTAPLPEGWYAWEYEEPRQAFISREEVITEQDQFDVGVSALVIPDISRRMSVSPLEIGTIYEMWLTLQAQTMYERDEFAWIINAEVLPVGNFLSLIMESSFDVEGDMIQVLSISTVKNDSLYHATFEAPVSEFHLHRPVFMDAIQELRWH